MRVAICAAAVMFWVLTPNAATAFDPSVSEVCSPSTIRPGSRGEIDRRKLVGQLLLARGISDIELDTRGGDVTFPMKRSAILDSVSYCEIHDCGKDARKKLTLAYGDLRLFILDHSKQVEPRKTGIEILRSNGGSARITPEELLADPWVGITAACIVATDSSKSTEPGKNGDTDKDKVTQRFMVRKNVADLQYSQGDGDKFKSLDRATLSINADYLKSVTNYSLDGVAGYGIKRVGIGENGTADVVGFVSYTRQLAAGAVPKNSHDVDNVGFGVLGNAILESAGYYQSLQAYAQFIHSNVSDANLVSGNVVYSPLTGLLIGRPVYVGTIAMLLTPQAKFVYGYVLDQGLDLNLAGTSNFSRGGGKLELLMVDDGGLFNGFSIRVAYEYLKVFVGMYNSIDRFESKLSYKFPDQQFWSIDLAYVSGRNLDTLELQKQLTLGVGFKY